MIAAAEALGATTALISPGRGAVDTGVVSRRGRNGLGALVVVHDTGAAGPRDFDAEALELLDRCHGIFIVADPGEDELATIIATARGAVVGVVLTSAVQAEAWSMAMTALAPRAIRMTAIGARRSPTVAGSGMA
jgi:hypothetical protein